MPAQRQLAGGQKNTVYALILTHSDVDHYNKVNSFFGKAKILQGTEMPWSRLVLDEDVELAAISINNIYLSNGNLAENRYHEADKPLEKYYKQSNLGANVKAGNFGTPNLHNVTINSTEPKKNVRNTWTALHKYEQVIQDPIANRKLPVLLGKTDGIDWSISIIAGNVPRNYGGVQDGATADNAKSLITLFQIGDKKALLCGDATFSTEKFLLDAHSKTIANVDLLQIPHHGSAYASSDAFVKLVNPRAAVISVEFFEHSHHLPRYEDVVSRWKAKVLAHENKRDPHENKIDPHDIDYWLSTVQDKKSKKMRYITRDDIDGFINTWRSDKKIKQQGNYLYYMSKPGAEVWAVTTSGGNRFLYRESQVDTNLTVTSQHTHVYRLSDTALTYDERPSHAG